MNNIYPLQSDHSLFRYLTPEERTHVESLAREVRIDEGGFLIRERERDSTLFTVEEGRLEIVVYNEGEAKTIATVGPGDVLGEVSFIDDSARTVSVRAAEDTRVFAWERDHLSAELARNPELLAKFSIAMCELLVERLRDSVRRM